jgi:uncharacterized membrane protein
MARCFHNMSNTTQQRCNNTTQQRCNNTTQQRCNNTAQQRARAASLLRNGAHACHSNATQRRCNNCTQRGARAAPILRNGAHVLQQYMHNNKASVGALDTTCITTRPPRKCWSTNATPTRVPCHRCWNVSLISRNLDTTRIRLFLDVSMNFSALNKTIGSCVLVVLKLREIGDM